MFSRHKVLPPPTGAARPPARRRLSLRAAFPLIPNKLETRREKKNKRFFFFSYRFVLVWFFLNEKHNLHNVIPVPRLIVIQLGWNCGVAGCKPARCRMSFLLTLSTALRLPIRNLLVLFPKQDCSQRNWKTHLCIYLKKKINRKSRNKKFGGVQNKLTGNKLVSLWTMKLLLHPFQIWNEKQMRKQGSDEHSWNHRGQEKKTFFPFWAFKGHKVCAI